MEEIISKQEVDKFMGLKGEVRGMSLTPEMKFLIEDKGEEALKKLEDAMTKIGHPIKYKDIRPLDYYPLGLQALIMIAMKRLFNYNHEDFAKMGIAETKSPLIIRLFMKYFISIDRAAKELPKMWRKYFTVGDLKIVEINKKEKYVVLRLYNFDLIPEKCSNIVGYSSNIIKMITGSKNVNYKETKCTFRGDGYHEFLLEW